ncbi:DUF423 domain-containing protein [Brevundimonas sp. M20]|jgi:uncharacterized membrane protein YgdD (TMEM256/DUF423 family)|uniref:DUF423 domain-containing protein n=1 Tax=Brevundimonas sp. M20 TaxID=2591463 RepID=UPI001146A3CB|nr:DUF423 domain-containing protein [Brevundimonas sp. M20]QDH73685.1 DUF423 domain-containing protein [Brevundimonas sp. M20]
MSVNRNLAAFAAVNGAMAVAVGAFAAHGAGPQIKTLLTTGAQYQLAHALLGIACALWPSRPRLVTIAGWIATTGGMIFALSLTLYGFLQSIVFMMITPIGGTLMIAAWLLLVLAALRTTRSNA